MLSWFILLFYRRRHHQCILHRYPVIRPCNQALHPFIGRPLYAVTETAVIQNHRIKTISRLKASAFPENAAAFCCKVERIGQRQNFPLVHISRTVFGSPKDLGSQNRLKHRPEHIQCVAAADICTQSDFDPSVQIVHDRRRAAAAVHVRLRTMRYQHIALFQCFHLFRG